MYILIYVGSFDNIPAFDPHALSCSGVITTTLCTSAQAVETSTASDTSTRVISRTTIPAQTIIPHLQFPSPTSGGKSADGAQNYLTILMIATAVSVAVAVLIIMVAAMIKFIVRSVHISYAIYQNV